MLIILVSLGYYSKNTVPYPGDFNKNHLFLIVLDAMRNPKSRNQQVRCLVRPFWFIDVGFLSVSSHGRCGGGQESSLGSPFYGR